MTRGLFIAFEGIDGSGTTTQVALLTDWLRSRGHRVHPTREPSDGPVGVTLRQILKHRLVVPVSDGRSRPFDPGAVALLFAADRLDHLDAEVVPRLEDGQTVISDRYVYSSLAYQSLELDLEWVSAINGRAQHPDLTVFLRLEPGRALERIGSRQGEARELYEQEETLARVTATYDQLLARGLVSHPMVLDGARPIIELAEEIRGRVEQLLGAPRD